MGDSGAAASFDWQMRLRRPEGVALTPVVDGFVVYQHDRDKVHYLNQTAAILLEVCDGSLRAADLPGFLAVSFSLPAAPREEVAECLRRLLAEGLLEAIDIC
jgi:hypothetical protein